MKHYGALLLLSASAMLTGCGSFQVRQPPPLTYARHTAEAHNDFGVAYEDAGELERALQQYRKSVEKAPASPTAWTNLGNVLFKSGRGAEARDAYRQALALAPGYGPAVNNLAMAYLEDEPPRPGLALQILESHLALVDQVYLASVEETLAEVRAARADPP